ncbi:hypothetical protein BTVI_59779 [Pitangus sulphuratus]|nr:hypothetical protein BTVI_59779 [Pitangus sulphuratus]
MHSTCVEKKQQQVMVIGDSLLSRMEAPIYRLDRLFTEVYCLPGVQIRDVIRRLMSSVQPSDYYLLLLFHMGTNDIATRRPRSIKRDFRALGRMLKDSGEEVVFPSILPVMGRINGRNRHAQNIDIWLQDWCLHQNFVFYNHGRVCKTQGMLGPDGIHLPQWGKCFFAHKLAGQIERTLEVMGEGDTIRRAEGKPRVGNALPEGGNASGNIHAPPGSTGVLEAYLKC